MTTSAARMREWKGPALLSFGFRPFFLFGSVWAAVALSLWVIALAGGPFVPTAFDMVSWHAHEMLFGYLGAVLAGFLLTAVPNWTGRLPMTGWPLAALFALWVAGRIGVSMSAHLGFAAAAALDLAFPVALIAVLAREIVAGRNWRNLPVLALIGGFALANGLYHQSAASGGFPAGEAPLRIGLGVAVMMILVIGGRIVPSFTRNWLAARGDAARPVPFGANDRTVIILGGVAVIAWAARPEGAITALLCLAAGLATFWRMARWCGWRTLAEPLVWVLHAGFAFVPSGFLAIAAAAVGLVPRPAAEHVWTAGAVGLMTLAVMTRASLGHSGRPLTASAAISALYWALILSVTTRFLAALLPDQTWLLHVAAAGWIAAFGGFAVIYWPILTRPRFSARRPN